MLYNDRRRNKKKLQIFVYMEEELWHGGEVE
jgi:hypothetical protein